jgi:hypothetical protein
MDMADGLRAPRASLGGRDSAAEPTAFLFPADVDVQLNVAETGAPETLTLGAC